LGNHSELKEKYMTRKLTTFLSAAAVLMGITAATAVFAEDGTPATQPPHTQGMMSDHGGIMMGQMSRDHVEQLTRMADNCNRMMESMSNPPAEHDKERTPAPNG
jgi:hypothetical protein